VTFELVKWYVEGELFRKRQHGELPELEKYRYNKNFI
jgi:hypothetical protein